jgi:hypothetical protein
MIHDTTATQQVNIYQLINVYPFLEQKESLKRATWGYSSPLSKHLLRIQDRLQAG